MTNVSSDLLSSCPQTPPQEPLTHTSLVDAIVRIYVRQISTVECHPVAGSPRKDTVYDAIMDHYQHQTAPGMFNHNLIRDPESPVGRLLRSLPPYGNSTKVATFCFFLGISSQVGRCGGQGGHYQANPRGGQRASVKIRDGVRARTLVIVSGWLPPTFACMISSPHRRASTGTSPRGTSSCTCFTRSSCFSRAPGGPPSGSGPRRRASPSPSRPPMTCWATSSTSRSVGAALQQVASPCCH